MYGDVSRPSYCTGYHSKALFFSKTGSMAMRCSQSSGCRWRLPRCRKRSMRLVSVAPAVPGSTWPGTLDWVNPGAPSLPSRSRIFPVGS